MTGMEFVDSNPESFTTKSVGSHRNCGGELLDVETVKIKFRLCRKCRKESFNVPAEDMVDRGR